MLEDKEAICIATLKDMSTANQKKVFKEIIDEKKPLKTREDSLLALSPMGLPSTRIRDRLWLIVVGAFAIVLVGSFLALASGLIFFRDNIAPELVLTMFTSVVGFLAGLFTPSPVANRSREDNG